MTERFEKRAYSVTEAARYLGLSEWVIRNELAANRLAAKKRNSTVLIDRDELDRYFDDLPERV